MMGKDRVTNISTALMTVKDMATYDDIPIEMLFENHYIHIYVGYRTPYQKYALFYTQNLYRVYSETDGIRKWIESAIEEIQKEKSEHGFTSKGTVNIREKLDNDFKEWTSTIEEIRGKEDEEK